MIPASQIDQSSEPSVGPLASMVFESFPQTAATERRAVLVVDDDRDIRNVLRELLADEGYQVVEATNGAEALAILGRTTAPLVVLLDLMMPIMDGFEVCQKLNQDAKLRDHHAIVLMSARRNLKVADLTDIQATVSKPFEIEALLQLVARFAAPPPAPKTDTTDTSTSDGGDSKDDDGPTAD